MYPDSREKGYPPVRDALGRTFRKLRLSVTSACNFHCAYCDPLKSSKGNRQDGSALDPYDYVRIVRMIHDRTPLDSVRITGGEPLLYRALPELIEGIRGTGIGKVTITTNALLLKRRLGDLLQAGLDGINISLDATTAGIFKRISGGGSLSSVVEGIDAVMESPLRVKINSTIMRGVNDSEILLLFEFARRRGITLRFIELMEMGPIRNSLCDRIVTKDEILRIIGGVCSVRPLDRIRGETARYYEAGEYRFGIIENASDPFCGDCDRLRLDSNGILYGCLSVPEGQKIDRLSSGEMEAILIRALAQKQTERFLGSDLSMRSIGG